MYDSTVSSLANCPEDVHGSRDDAGARPLASRCPILVRYLSRWLLGSFPSLSWHFSFARYELIILAQPTSRIRSTLVYHSTVLPA